MKTDCMNDSEKRKPGPARQRGFSLLEVLVAMLVLGVAVMGFAGLQVRALQSTGTAHLRSQAMTIASEMTERIRGNPSALATYTTAANWGVGTIPSGAPSTWAGTCMYTSTTTNGCSAANMALFDMREVQYLAQELLPNGTVSVRYCDGGGLVACVFVGWSENGVTSDAKVNCTNNTDPNCVSMRVVVQ